jgi:hypothetical protein
MFEFNSSVYAKHKGVIYQPMDCHNEIFIIRYEQAKKQEKKWGAYIIASASFPGLGLGISRWSKNMRHFKYSCILTAIAMPLSFMMWKENRGIKNAYCRLFQIGLQSHRIIRNPTLPVGSKLIHIYD